MKDRVLRRADTAVRGVANTSAMKGNKTNLIRLSGIKYVILYKFLAFTAATFQILVL